MPDVGERAVADREHHAHLRLLAGRRLGTRRDAGVRIAVGVGEPGPVAPLRERAERDRVLRRGGRDLVHRHHPAEAVEPREDVAPPRPVVDLGAHGVAVLAVVGQRDAELGLPLDDVDRGVVELLRVVRLVDAFAVHPAAVELDEVVRPRKAAGVARRDTHASSPQMTRFLSGRTLACAARLCFRASPWSIPN